MRIFSMLCPRAVSCVYRVGSCQCRQAPDAGHHESGHCESGPQLSLTGVMSHVQSLYPSNGFVDELAWAAAWLYSASNSTATNYLTDARKYYGQAVAQQVSFINRVQSMTCQTLRCSNILPTSSQYVSISRSCALDWDIATSS